MGKFKYGENGDQTREEELQKIAKSTSKATVHVVYEHAGLSARARAEVRIYQYANSFGFMLFLEDSEYCGGLWSTKVLGPEIFSEYILLNLERDAERSVGFKATRQAALLWIQNQLGNLYDEIRTTRLIDYDNISVWPEDSWALVIQLKREPAPEDDGVRQLIRTQIQLIISKHPQAVRLVMKDGAGW